MRGLLEPPVEYEVLLLPPGLAGEPIEPPRGSWVVERVEPPEQRCATARDPEGGPARVAATSRWRA